MKLLVDSFAEKYEVKTLTEAAGKEKNLYITGIFAQANKQNRNGRNYPRKSMEKAYEAYSKLIEAKRALGELNHPPQPQVDLERASHIIESLKWDGDNLIGKARVLTKLPMGKVVEGLIGEGVQIGVSTRGLGSLVEKNGINEVQDDYIMTAIDIVGDPSAPDAFVQGIMESAEWVYNASTNSWILAEQIKNDVRKMTTVQVAESQARMFSAFLNSLK